MNKELKQILDQLSEAEKLYRFTKNENFPQFEKLFRDSIDLLKDISTIEGDFGDFSVEVRARQISIKFLEGILDSLTGAKQNLEHLQSNVEKIKKVGKKMSENYG